MTAMKDIRNVSRNILKNVDIFFDIALLQRIVKLRRHLEEEFGERYYQIPFT